MRARDLYVTKLFRVKGEEELVELYKRRILAPLCANSKKSQKQYKR